MTCCAVHCRRGMFGDVEMHDTAPFVGQDHQDEEHAGHRRHDKEIQGHQVLHMVLQECLPRRRWRLVWPHPILLHRRLGHVDAQLAQFPDDPWRTPGRIGLPHRLG